MKRKIRNTLLFLLMLVAGQQGLSWLGVNLPVYNDQQEIMIRENMDPSAFFYTESEHALQAAKEVRKRVEVSGE